MGTRETAATLVWFRSDLRLADNPALTAALAAGTPVRALFVVETDPDLRPIGGASRWWLHHSLNALAADLASLDIDLDVREGASAEIVPEEAARLGATALHWNRRYGPAERAHDAAIKQHLSKGGIAVSSHAASVLVEPFDIATASGTPYGVFTPFWKALRQRDIAPPLPTPRPRQSAPDKAPKADASYRMPKWSEKLAAHWQIGERSAQRRATAFLDDLVGRYPEARDLPGEDGTSRLSPHLHFGEIGPRQLWHAARTYAASHADAANGIDKFLSELAWREFSTHLLYHRPDIATVPMQARFADTPWRHDATALAAWQRGATGLPIVDAGMRQLWATGWMHNRVRMLAASLLTKNLLIDWRLGERWFWDTLVDADPANNPASWQWVAGCGADAAPYFRIFNPVTQGEKFDSDGVYVRRFVPELARLPNKWVHRPFEAPADVLAAAGIRLGDTYPAPIVDLKTSRQRALDALGRND